MGVSRPNILFIMADQFRHDYMGCAGAAFAATPHIDSIAARGMRFTQCTTTAPVCAPARIGLASGLDPWRLGALDNNCHLPLGTPTYYQRLRDSGYRVGVVGKLDLAKPCQYNGREGRRPLTYTWGFTDPLEVEGKMHAGRHPNPHGPYGAYLERKGLYKEFHDDYRRRSREGWATPCHDSVLSAGDVADAYVGDRAAQWLREITDEYPWHLFVSFPGPHDPFDPPTSYARRYRAAQMPPALPALTEGMPRWHERRRLELTPQKVAETRRQYCASIAVIDDAIGTLLDIVQNRDLAENTIVIFAGDHGEMLGDHGFYTKSLPCESCLRVPLVVAGPGVVAGGVSNALIELADVNPTICELAGLPRQQKVDAVSFSAVLGNPGAAHRSSQAAALRQFRLIRTGRYKLVENYNDSWELYDLQKDPDELVNIFGVDKELQNDMIGRLRARFTDPVHANEGKI